MRQWAASGEIGPGTGVAGFSKLYKSAVRHTVEYPLPPNAGPWLLKNYGICLASCGCGFPPYC
jgi:hypothetical protein